MKNLSALSDDELLLALGSLTRQSNQTEAELLLHLAEVDARKLYLDRAHASLFSFCLSELNFSEAVTQNRIVVARAARQYPQIIAFVRSGQIHLSGLRILAPHLTAENSDGLLAESVGRSKRQIEEIVARVSPQPALPDLIRRLPAQAQVQVPPTLMLAPIEVETPPTPTFVFDPPGSPQMVAPLSAEAFKVQFTAPRSLRDKIAQAQELLRHQVPSGDLASIFERALDLLIRETKKQRFAIGCKPRQSQVRAARVTRHIPDAMKRAVYQRDEGQCTFVDDRGRRCASRDFLEFDHREGFARNHTHSLEQLRLLCRSHNQRAADELYGEAFMRRRREPIVPKAAGTAPPSL